MIRLTPTTPENCDVRGRIYWDPNLTILGEDMVDVMLPSGILISCGWYPEGDPAGRFVITASEGFEELRRVETTKVIDALSIVESLTSAFYGSSFASKNTSSSLLVESCV